ncbi:hypothetical protein HQ533_01715, partial [Candidatus Woesearchaeota archaeon]|nr:hypothetical protein [Candidatus Woesearchaeota archaeon]
GGGGGGGGGGDGGNIYYSFELGSITQDHISVLKGQGGDGGTGGYGCSGKEEASNGQSGQEGNDGSQNLVSDLETLFSMFAIETAEGDVYLLCNDQEDNDGDGRTDMEDPDCYNYQADVDVGEKQWNPMIRKTFSLDFAPNWFDGSAVNGLDGVCGDDITENVGFGDYAFFDDNFDDNNQYFCSDDYDVDNDDIDASVPADWHWWDAQGVNAYKIHTITVN